MPPDEWIGRSNRSRYVSKAKQGMRLLMGYPSRWKDALRLLPRGVSQSTRQELPPLNRMTQPTRQKCPLAKEAQEHPHLRGVLQPFAPMFRILETPRKLDEGSPDGLWIAKRTSRLTPVQQFRNGISSQLHPAPMPRFHARVNKQHPSRIISVRDAHR